ncbi:unnamed protein product [Prorocentrum cordatum]|uniref:Uncharacterized protein n=1 Tax=Prorocentrum cordatum TaxID=2364126 RepID=A0ABN9S159_9DINO|nr:unnamed protein product [Polarella glacialis]
MSVAQEAASRPWPWLAVAAVLVAAVSAAIPTAVRRRRSKQEEGSYDPSSGSSRSAPGSKKTELTEQGSEPSEPAAEAIAHVCPEHQGNAKSLAAAFGLNACLLRKSPPGHAEESAKKLLEGSCTDRRTDSAKAESKAADGQSEAAQRLLAASIAEGAQGEQGLRAGKKCTTCEHPYKRFDDTYALSQQNRDSMQTEFTPDVSSPVRNWTGWREAALAAQTTGSLRARFSEERVQSESGRVPALQPRVLGEDLQWASAACAGAVGLEQRGQHESELQATLPEEKQLEPARSARAAGEELLRQQVSKLQASLSEEQQRRETALSVAAAQADQLRKHASELQAAAAAEQARLRQELGRLQQRQGELERLRANCARQSSQLQQLRRSQEEYSGGDADAIGAPSQEQQRTAKDEVASLGQRLAAEPENNATSQDLAERAKLKLQEELLAAKGEIFSLEQCLAAQAQLRPTKPLAARPAPETQRRQIVADMCSNVEEYVGKLIGNCCNTTSESTTIALHYIRSRLHAIVDVEADAFDDDLRMHESIGTVLALKKLMEVWMLVSLTVDVPPIRSSGWGGSAKFRSHFKALVPWSVSRVELRCRWRDENLGVSHGRLRLTIRRNGTVVSEVDCFAFAPHVWVKEVVAFSSSQLGDPLPGDTLSLEYAVGSFEIRCLCVEDRRTVAACHRAVAGRRPGSSARRPRA